MNNLWLWGCWKFVLRKNPFFFSFFLHFLASCKGKANWWYIYIYKISSCSVLFLNARTHKKKTRTLLIMSCFWELFIYIYFFWSEGKKCESENRGKNRGKSGVVEISLCFSLFPFFLFCLVGRKKKEKQWLAFHEKNHGRGGGLVWRSVESTRLLVNGEPFFSFFSFPAPSRRYRLGYFCPYLFIHTQSHICIYIVPKERMCLFWFAYFVGSISFLCLGKLEPTLLPHMLY